MNDQEQTQLPTKRLCTRCGCEEGEVKLIATFVVKDDRHTTHGKVFQHDCKCITTAACEHNVGAPESDDYFGVYKLLTDFTSLYTNATVTFV